MSRLDFWGYLHTPHGDIAISTGRTRDGRVLVEIEEAEEFVGGVVIVKTKAGPVELKAKVAK